MLKRIFYRLNKIVIRFLGGFLYPYSKCGKEEKNKRIIENYK